MSFKCSILLPPGFDTITMRKRLLEMPKIALSFACSYSQTRCQYLWICSYGRPTGVEGASLHKFTRFRLRISKIGSHSHLHTAQAQAQLIWTKAIFDYNNYQTSLYLILYLYICMVCLSLGLLNIMHRPKYTQIILLFNCDSDLSLPGLLVYLTRNPAVSLLNKSLNRVPAAKVSNGFLQNSSFPKAESRSVLYEITMLNIYTESTHTQQWLYSNSLEL